ncbi:MAG: four helix bundle protein [Desulfobacterales bacterium]
MANKTNELSIRIVKFVGRVIKLVDAVKVSFAGKKIADQLVRSSTSVGANYEEAHGTGSRADFINKLQIALKEARETRYWLSVVLESGLALEFSLEPLVDESNQLCKILGKSVATARGTGKMKNDKRQTLNAKYLNL